MVEGAAVSIVGATVDATAAVAAVVLAAAVGAAGVVPLARGRS